MQYCCVRSKIRSDDIIWLSLWHLERHGSSGKAPVSLNQLLSPYASEFSTVRLWDALAILLPETCLVKAWHAFSKELISTKCLRCDICKTVSALCFVTFQFCQNATNQLHFDTVHVWLSFQSVFSLCYCVDCVVIRVSMWSTFADACFVCNHEHQQKAATELRHERTLLF